MHVYESGFFSNTHIGDGIIVFNQLVLNQPTPVALNLTQALGKVIVPGKLHINVKALDFGHEIIQVAPQATSFQPHYFIASSMPLASTSGPSASNLPSSAITLNGGQQIYIQPMGGAPAGPGATLAPAALDASTPLTAMPTANGGFMFYAMPPQGSHHASHVPAEPAPSYASLDHSQQYTTDFTYEAPSAPTETLIPRGVMEQPRPSHATHAIVEQSPPPISNSSSPPPYSFGNQDSLI
jgi:hypothetical protein